MRRSLRKPKVNVNFFFFQDIITAALGVILFIALILALNIDTTTNNGQNKERSSVLLAAESRLNALLSQLAEKRSLLKQLSTLVGPMDKDALEREVRFLRSELQSWSGTLATKSTPLAIASNSIELDAALQSRKSDLAALEKETQTVNASLNAASQATTELEAKLKDLESELLAQEQLKNRIWLIPQSSGTSKAPLLITLASGGCEFQRFGKVTEKRILNGTNLQFILSAILKGFSKEEHYVVLYFKPSALSSFDAARRYVNSKGFEVGTDVISEDTVLDFSPSVP